MVDKGSNVTTQAGYARKVGKSRQAIHKATKGGRVILDTGGKVDESATEAASETMAAARLREQIARASMAETKARALAGEVIDRALVERQVAEFVALFKAAAVAFPARNGPLLAGEFEVAEHALVQRLDAMIEDLLQEVSSAVLRI